jgi:hypothetical protein
MDQKIKNFDRGIEQMMNEHEVAPPFGMWNRISAELEAMPVPVAAAAPVVTSLIPKRAIAGIIASALIIGASIATGYMVHSTLDTKNKVEANTKPISVPVTAATVAANNTPAQTVEPVKRQTTPVVPVLAKAKVNHIADKPAQTTLQAAQQVSPAAVQPAANTVGVADNSLMVNNSNTDVPTPIEPIAQNVEPQTYYFPPIDVNTPEKAKANDAPIAVKAHANTKVSASTDDDKSSNTGERKFRLRNHKKPFTWSKINTNK